MLGRGREGAEGKSGACSLPQWERKSRTVVTFCISTVFPIYKSFTVFYFQWGLGFIVWHQKNMCVCVHSVCVCLPYTLKRKRERVKKRESLCKGAVEGLEGGGLTVGRQMGQRGGG